jgi:hypothetical protein
VSFHTIELGSNHPDSAAMLGFTHDEAGNQWRGFMNEHMGQWLRNANFGQLPYDQQVQILVENNLMEPVASLEFQSESFRMRTQTSTDASVVGLVGGLGTEELRIISVSEQIQDEDGVFRWAEVYAKGRTAWVREDGFFDQALNPFQGATGNMNFTPTSEFDPSQLWQVDMITGPDGYTGAA